MPEILLPVKAAIFLFTFMRHINCSPAAKSGFNITEKYMGLKEKASESIRGIKEEAKVLKGEKTKDKQYLSTRKFDDEASAQAEFKKAEERLYNVNAWSEIPGVANAAFELYSSDGQPITRDHVQNDDFVRIDLPGPLPFYWVKVIEISNGDDHAQFTVQPSHDPTKREDPVVTDHFFRDHARSIFRIERHGSEIIAMEIGLNEAINNQGGEAGEKRLINTLVSEGGWAGFQKYQWKNLTEYLVGVRTPDK